MNEDWIKLYREIMNEEWFKEPFTRGQAWIDLLLLAAHKDRKFYLRGNVVNQKRGQVNISERDLAARWQWSRGKVRRFIIELENEHKIIPQKTNLTTWLSIVNYEKYQSDNTTDNTTNGKLG